MKTINKLKQILNPHRMYKFCLFMVVLNMIFALVCFFIGLSHVYAQLFLANGICFLMGGIANWWMIRLHEAKSNKSDK